MNVEFLDFALILVFIYLYVKINFLRKNYVLKYSVKTLVLITLILAIASIIVHVFVHNTFFTTVTIIFEILLYSYLLGLLLLLAVGVDEQYTLYGLAHPISIAVLYILAAAFFILNVNNIDFNALNLIRFFVLLTLLLYIVRVKGIKKVLYLNFDVLLVIAIGAFIVISFLIAAPNYLVYSEDTQMDVYTSTLLSEFNDYIKGHVISIYFTPFHLVLSHFTNEGFNILPAIVLALLLLTPFQSLTMYFIIKNYLNGKESFIAYLLTISGMSSVFVIGIISGRDYFLPTPLSPLIPENFARYILRYKYFYTALFSALAAQHLYFSTQIKSVSNSNVIKAFLFFLLGITSSLHPLALVYALALEIAIMYLHIKKAKPRTLVYIISYSMGIVFSLITFMNIKNTLIGTTLADLINTSLRLSLATHMISFVKYLLVDNNSIITVALIVLMILIILLIKSTRLQKIIVNNGSVMVVTLILASLLVETLKPQYYEQYRYFSKILPWRIGPYPSFMILSFAFPLISLVLLNTFKNTRKHRQLILMVLISVISVLIINLVDMGVFSYRFLIPLQISAAITLVSFINKRIRMKRRVLMHVFFLSILLFFIIDPMITFNSLLTYNYGAAKLYSYYELYHIIGNYDKHSIAIINYIAPTLRLPQNMFSAIYYAKQPSYLKLISDINISFVIVEANSRLMNYPKYLELRGLVNKTRNYYIIRWIHCGDGNSFSFSNFSCIIDFFCFKNDDALIKDYDNFIKKCIQRNHVVLIAPFDTSICRSGNIDRIRRHIGVELDNRYLALSKSIDIEAKRITIHADSIYYVQYFKNLSSIIVPVKVKFIGYNISLHNIRAQIIPAISTYYVYLYVKGRDELYVLRNPIIIIHNYRILLRDFTPVTFNRVFYYKALLIAGEILAIKYYYTLLYGWHKATMAYYIKPTDSFVATFIPRMDYILSVKVNNCFTIAILWIILFLSLLFIKMLFSSLRNGLGRY